MLKTKTLLISAIIATGFISALLLLDKEINVNAQSNPCGPSDNAAKDFAPGGPGGYPPGQNPYNKAPGGAPGQLKQDQTPLP
jgi:hypothetical protein